MSRPIMLGTFVALMVLQTPLAALASASTDAENAVIEDRTISYEQLRSYGPQYVTDFINAYHYGTITYRQGYQAGTNDYFHHRLYQPPQNHVGQVGYQRGWQRAQNVQTHSAASLRQEASTPSNEKRPTNHIDDQQYPVNAPAPNQAHFINRIAKLAQRLGKQYDLYPSVIIAQAALESNWGSSDLSRSPYHNLFGVKDNGRGDTIMAPTIEYFAGHQHQVKDRFRTYDSDWASLLDYGETLQNSLYHNVHRSVCSHYRQATYALLGKYATDPEYDRKLNRLIDQYQLTKYDQPLRKSAVHHPVRATYHDVTDSASNHHSSSHTSHHYPTPIVSVMGGAGTAGLFQLVRRFLFK